MNGTLREAVSVTFVRKMTDEDVQATKARLQMKEEPQTLVHFFAPASQKSGIAHPVAASVEAVIDEFAKAGITLTVTASGSDKEPVEAVHMAAVIQPLHEFKPAPGTPEERKVFGTKVLFKDWTGEAREPFRETWLLARSKAFHGRDPVPGFGNGNNH
jgi:hypothetical protein